MSKLWAFFNRRGAELWAALNLNIRPYTAQDYQTVLNIYAQAKLDELRFEAASFNLVPLDQDAKRLAVFEQSEVYIYEHDSVLGYCARHGSEITALFVHPEARGRGVGARMLEFLLSLIDDDACLFIVASNAPAKQLYEKFGFLPTHYFYTDYGGNPVLAGKMVRAAASA